ncbi:restriction endonuclease subunit S [Thauera aromatica]|uniref:restriction endonuclease subunit S n=1 Tax=Thauera aromatica TaxID=59405 RepID=UPI001FFC8AC9|nr:restriction endonuclease subunit S [Thauera aromatica]MCK2097070.1 restriction endonuclease subunit S [Thauera aromatica]
MASEWIDTTIGVQLTLQRGFDITKANQRSGTVPVISSGGVSSFHDTAIRSGPGVVLGRKGVVGSVWFIRTDYWPHDTTLWVKDFRGNNPRFVYYFFKSLAPTITTLDVGSANPTLNRNHVHPLEIRWPPLSEQRAIAHILGTLDDKIELNRRTNETLEAMARALFKAWFVDFEPVRAKLEGRWQRGQSLPGLPAHLYDLFPDRLVESELGEIPEGWRVSTIGGEVSVCGGATPSTKEPEFWEGGSHCWATPKDLSALQFPVLMDTDRKITDAGLAKIGSGLLPGGTVLLSSRAPIGYLAIAEVPTAINQGFIAMRCDGVLPNVFVLQWCRENMDAIVGNANGSTFQEISKSNFRPIPIVVPPEPVLAGFRRSADVLHLKLVENERESRCLAQLRDTLLPKLISGELRVPDAEAFLKERGL